MSSQIQVNQYDSGQQNNFFFPVNVPVSNNNVSNNSQQTPQQPIPRQSLQDQNQQQQDRLQQQVALLNQQLQSVQQSNQTQNNFQQQYTFQPLPQPQIARIKGRVRRFDSRDRKIFFLYTVTLEKEFRVQCKFFCPLQEDDVLDGIAEMTQDLKGPILNLLRPPFVQMAMDKDSIVRCWLRCLRTTGFGQSKAYDLYERIANSRGSGEKIEVTNYLSELAQIWNDLQFGELKRDRVGDDLQFGVMQQNSSNNISTVTSENLTILDCFCPPLNKTQAEKLLTWWHKNRNLRRLYLFGLNNKEIRNSKLSCDEVYNLCITNPYRIVSVSIEKCKTIWDRIGKTPTDAQTRQGFIARKIYECTEEKAWTGVPSRILHGHFPDSAEHYEALVNDYSVVGELNTIYLKYPHKVETRIAEIVKMMLEAKPSEEKVPSDSSSGKIEANYLNKELSDEQKAAITGALNSYISLIPGGAGTGKTTIIAELVHNLQLLEIPFLVASFTGKAVARIREVIKQKGPSTIHRLITRGNESTKSRSFTKNKKGFVIIDEASMVTSDLFYTFGEAYGWNFRCVLIGDSEQLQPIGWGSLFSQLINANCIPTFRLTKNYRTDVIIDEEQNGILINSKAIIEYGKSLIGSDEDLPFVEPFNLISTVNFCILEGRIENVFDIVRSLYSHGIECDKITIITPYNRFLRELNSTVQQIYNDGKAMITDALGIPFMIGDRVMFTVNCYEYNIMNGEEGKVTDIDDEFVYVTFYDNIRHLFKYKFEKKEDDEKEPESGDVYEKIELTTKLLIHSFALTIHKSQGSEWEYVVFFMPTEVNASSFLNRNLIYTGITRARKAIWCIGDITALNTAAIRPPPYRCDNLSKRLTM